MDDRTVSSAKDWWPTKRSISISPIGLTLRPRVRIFSSELHELRAPAAGNRREKPPRRRRVARRIPECHM
ncbi:hypothetical protein [Bradyrhizobium algeriense]|uniref:hypothetical protein n=1 Tax=Bradyrhizobium algeriense TaxID=634784 RepID=UPI00167D4708